MTVALDLSLPRLALEIAVDQLTKPEAAPVKRDDGTPIRTPVPALLVQLAEAKDANSGRGGAFAARSKPPLWIDAVSLLDEIDTYVSHFSSRQGRAGRVRAWAARMHDLTDLYSLEGQVELAESWVRRARALLDPDPPIELDGTCPVCKRGWVECADEEGEIVVRRALHATEGDLKAWCEHCSSRWDGELLWVLADHLKRQTASETLAEEEPTP